MDDLHDILQGHESRAITDPAKLACLSWPTVPTGNGVRRPRSRLATVG